MGLQAAAVAELGLAGRISLRLEKGTPGEVWTDRVSLRQTIRLHEPLQAAGIGTRRLDRRRFGFGLSGFLSMVFLGVALWGLHLGATQGLLAATVADTAPADLRGTAFGVFNLLSDLAMLIASALAGLLWDRLGPGFTFSAGALFCGLTLVGMALMPRVRFRVVGALRSDQE